MSKIYISGGKRLEGKINLQGAKNSVLPILAASLAVKGASTLHNCPNLSDVRAAIKILEALGCKCKFENNTIFVDSNTVSESFVPESLMREMRSSVVFLGAMLARNGYATITAPGGCELGPRPIDLHLKAISELGYSVTEKDGYITCKREKTNPYTEIYLNFPSVGATENVILASSTRNGTVLIHNAAKEPEIVDLANFINKAGGRVRGAGTDRIEIVGVSELDSVEHFVIPDRIVAATYMSASAITGGDITIANVDNESLKVITSTFQEAGCEVFEHDRELRILSSGKLKRINPIRSMVYPGFPTDAGPLLIASLLKASGTSVFIETIFENRFNYVEELKRLGSDIKVFGKIAVIEGREALFGAKLRCTDLRGGAAVVVAALGAQGDSVVTDIHHIERGYENIEVVLRSLNAQIKKE